MLALRSASIPLLDRLERAISRLTSGRESRSEDIRALERAVGPQVQAHGLSPRAAARLFARNSPTFDYWTAKPSRPAACESRTLLQTMSSVSGSSPGALRAAGSCIASAARIGWTRSKRSAPFLTRCRGRISV